MDGTTFKIVFDCSDCVNFTDGKCDLNYLVGEYEDMYDCQGFQDATQVEIKQG